MATYKFIRGGGNEPTRSGLCNEICRHAMTKKFTAGYSNLRPQEILGLCGTTLPKLNAAYDMLNAPAIRHLMTDIRRVKRCIIIIIMPTKTI